MNFKQSFKEVKLNNELIEAATEDNRKKKEKFLSEIPLLLANGLYDKVDSSYQLLILIDTAEIDSYIYNVNSLHDQQEYAKAKVLYSLLSNKIDKTGGFTEATVFNNDKTTGKPVNKRSSSTL